MSALVRARMGFVWSLALSFVGQISNLATNVVVARTSLPTDFGRWAMVNSTILAIAGVAQLSMAITATRFTAAFKDADSARVSRLLRLCAITTLTTATIATVGLVAFADDIATYYLHEANLNATLRITAPVLFFTTVNGYQVGALAGFERFKELASASGASAVMSLAFIATGSVAFGINGAAAGASLSAFATWAVHRNLLHRSARHFGEIGRASPTIHDIREVAHFALPATLSGMLGAYGVWSTNVDLVHSSQGYHEFALYSVASNFRTVILFIPAALSRVTGPMLTNLFTTSPTTGYRRAVIANVIASIVFAAIVATAGSLAAPSLLPFFGESYVHATAMVRVLALAAVSEVLGGAIYQELYSEGRMWRGLTTVAARTIVIVVGSRAWTPGFGGLGLAWANLCAYTVFALVAWFIVKQTRATARQVRSTISPPRTN